jgi:hypothetical protein
MQYVKVVTTKDGGSRFVDIDVEQTAAPFAGLSATGGRVGHVLDLSR